MPDYDYTYVSDVARLTSGQLGATLRTITNIQGIKDIYWFLQTTHISLLQPSTIGGYYTQDLIFALLRDGFGIGSDAYVCDCVRYWSSLG